MQKRDHPNPQSSSHRKSGHRHNRCCQSIHDGNLQGTAAGAGKISFPGQRPGSIYGRYRIGKISSISPATHTRSPPGVGAKERVSSILSGQKKPLEARLPTRPLHSLWRPVQWPRAGQTPAERTAVHLLMILIGVGADFQHVGKQGNFPPFAGVSGKAVRAARMESGLALAAILYYV